MTDGLRVVIAEDSALLRQGVGRLLAEAGIEVAGQAGDADELLSRIRADPPDVALIDIRMPPGFSTEGLEAAFAIRNEFPDVAVLLLSQYVEPDYAFRLLQHGEGHVGYLLKHRVSHSRELVEAIRRVARGEPVVDPEVVAGLFGRRRRADPIDRLSGRERDVLALMAQGRSNHGISDDLAVSLKTVESHVRNIFLKLDLLPGHDDHRRVLAVLTYLRSAGQV